MSLPIKEVVRAYLMPSGMVASRRDLSMAVIMTPDTGIAFNDSSTRYMMASSADDVAGMFGSDSEVAEAARIYFAQRPQPQRVMVGRWARAAQEIAASSNSLRGSATKADVNILKEITAATFSLSVGGEDKHYAGIDLSKAVDLAGVAEAITAVITADGIECQYDPTGKRFIIASVATGANPATELGYVFDGGEPNYIGDDLRLEDGQAFISQGQDAATVAKESIVKALTTLASKTDFYGVYVAAALTDGELDGFHSYIASSDPVRVGAYTAVSQDKIAWDDGNILKTLAQKNSGRFMVQYNAVGDRHAGVALLAQSLSTNWRGQNTAQTLKFKEQPNVQYDDKVDLTVATACRRLGVNFYTDYEGVPMIAEGTMLGGIFIDETVGLDAFIDACQKQAFAILKGNPSKIPQTDKGQARIIGALNIVGREFNRNGFLAGGVWGGNDVGDLENGDRLEDGFYFYSDSYDFQTIPDREARKAMPIMAAIKLSGAIHNLDIPVQFNR